MKKITNYFLISALILGVSLRLAVYFQNRSFIIDEANLARNIVEKNYGEFFKPLDYEQYSPPVFSSALKVMTQLGGVNEYSLTLISLLAGIGTLILLFLIGRFLKLDPIPLLYLLLLFSFNELAIRYSTELKQYSLDAFLCLLFCYWYLRNRDKKWTSSSAFQLAIFGAFVVWCCMPIVFVLAAIGMDLLFRFLRQREFNFSYLIMIGMPWLISFGAYYFSILRVDATSDYLQNFHNRYFFDLLPFSREAMTTDYNLLLGLFRSVTDKTTISLIGCIVFFALGMFKLNKINRPALTILILPLVFCLLASHLHMYSLLTRLTLFLIPMLSLIMVYGFSWAWSKSNKYLKIGLAVFAMLTIVNKKGYEYFWTKMEFEDAKAGLNYIRDELGPDEMIYVHHAGVPAFLFYNELHDQAYNFENYNLGTWEKTIGVNVIQNQSVESSSSFWVFFSHTNPVSKLGKDFGSIENIANRVDEHKAKQMIVRKYLMHKK